MVISIDQFAEAVLNELEVFSFATRRAVDTAAEKTAKDAQAELRATSPSLTGDYAKGWAIKRETKCEKSGRASLIVHNKTDYQLTHLLENGHVKVVYGHRTGGRVKAHVHIAPVEDMVQREFEDLIVSGIGGIK